MMLVMATETGARFATPEEVREAIQKEWTGILPRLLRYARFLTLGDHVKARDLVERAVDSLLEPDRRRWPIDRVPSLRVVMLLAIKSHFLDDLRKKAKLDVYDREKDAAAAADWTFSPEVMNALAMHDDEVVRVIARAREILEGDQSGLAVHAVLEGKPRDEMALAREARRTGKYVNVAKELARRRMGRALDRAHAEARKS